MSKAVQSRIANGTEDAADGPLAKVFYSEVNLAMTEFGVALQGVDGLAVEGDGRGLRRRLVAGRLPVRAGLHDRGRGQRGAQDRGRRARARPAQGQAMTVRRARRYGLPWRGAEVARAAEAAGVTAFCSGEFVDHEAYSTLAEMALHTERSLVGPGHRLRVRPHAVRPRGRHPRRLAARARTRLPRPRLRRVQDQPRLVRRRRRPAGRAHGRPGRRRPRLAAGGERAARPLRRGVLPRRRGGRRAGARPHRRADPARRVQQADGVGAPAGRPTGSSATACSPGPGGTTWSGPRWPRAPPRPSTSGVPREHGWVITAVDDDDPERAVMDARRMIAFYLTVKTYDPYVEHHGWTAQTAAIREAFAARDTTAMGRAVTDDMLEAIAVCGTHRRRAGPRWPAAATRCPATSPTSPRRPSWSASAAASATRWPACALLEGGRREVHRRLPDRHRRLRPGAGHRGRDDPGRPGGRGVRLRRHLVQRAPRPVAQVAQRGRPRVARPDLGPHVLRRRHQPGAADDLPAGAAVPQPVPRGQGAEHGRPAVRRPPHRGRRDRVPALGVPRAQRRHERRATSCSTSRSRCCAASGARSPSPTRASTSPRAAWPPCPPRPSPAGRRC